MGEIMFSNPQETPNPTKGEADSHQDSALAVLKWESLKNGNFPRGTYVVGRWNVTATRKSLGEGPRTFTLKPYFRGKDSFRSGVASS